MTPDPQLFGLALIAVAVGAFFVRVAVRDRPERRIIGQIATATIVVILIGLVGLIGVTLLTIDMRAF